MQVGHVRPTENDDAGPCRVRCLRLRARGGEQTVGRATHLKGWRSPYRDCLVCRGAQFLSVQAKFTLLQVKTRASPHGTGRNHVSAVSLLTSP
jgi:hypothetical protein